MQLILFVLVLFSVVSLWFLVGSCLCFCFDIVSWFVGHISVGFMFLLLSCLVLLMCGDLFTLRPLPKDLY